MRSIRYAFIIILMINLFLMVGCSQPEYLTPYGDGTEAVPVTNDTIVTRFATMHSSTSLTTTTTETVVTTTTALVVPDEYRLCPTCNGEKVMCEYCKGTDKRPGQILNELTGIVEDYVVNCGMCSDEDPGYLYCETCQNQLIVKNKLLAASTLSRRLSLFCENLSSFSRIVSE